MTTVIAILLFIAGIVGAFWCGQKRKYMAMSGCLVVASASFVLLVLTYILVWGID